MTAAALNASVMLKTSCPQSASVTMRRSATLTIRAPSQELNLWRLYNTIPGLQGRGFYVSQIIASGQSWTLTFPAAGHYTLRFTSGRCMLPATFTPSIENPRMAAVAVSVTVKP